MIEAIEGELFCALWRQRRAAPFAEDDACHPCRRMLATPAGGCLPPLQADACHPFRIYNRQRGPREMKIELPTRRPFGHLILILSSTMKTASATAATVMGAVASVSVMLVVRPVRPQPSSGSSSSGSISSKHHCKNVVDGLTTTTATMATATTKAPAPAPALASQPGHDLNMGCTYKYAVCTYEYTGPPV